MNTNPDGTTTAYRCPHPLLVKHGFRIQQMYAASVSFNDRRLTWKKYGVRGHIRLEGLKALVRLYRKYCTRLTTVVALEEELRIRIAREFARERIEAGCAVWGDEVAA